MIRGTTVGVRLRVDGEPDRLGIETPTYSEPMDVPNVVIAPATTDDMERLHPDGATVAYTLHFPKTFDAETHDLRGALVTFWGDTYRVVGDPVRYMRENVRGPWFMPVGVERVDG